MAIKKLFKLFITFFKRKYLTDTPSIISKLIFLYTPTKIFSKTTVGVLLMWPSNFICFIDGYVKWLHHKLTLLRPQLIKGLILAHLYARVANYPAEYNMGHLYEADDNLSLFYRSIDPTNTFNLHIGKMPRTQRNRHCCL